MEIALYGGYIAQIDEEDLQLASQYKWYLNNGYAFTNSHRKGYSRGDKGRNRPVYLHRLVMGEPPRPGLFVDHRDRNRLDCRKKNLRWVSPQQSSWNKSPSAESGYKGVCMEEGRWEARIKGLYLGSAGTPETAAMIYDKAARHFFGEYAYLNFPDKWYSGDVRYVDFIPDKKKLQSSYTGVTYFGHGGKRVKRWRAVYRKKTLGYYMTEDEAAQAYQAARLRHEG